MREEIILDITVESGDLKAQFARVTTELEQNRQKLTAVRKEIRELTTAQKQLDTAYNQGKISAQAYAQQTGLLSARANALGEASANLILRQKELVQEQKSLARQIDLTRKATDGQSNSLNQLRARLALATTEFDKLSQEERQAEQSGKRLLTQINALQQEVRELEQTTGRSQRNVGNYGSAFKGLGQNLTQIAGQIPGLGGAVSALSGGPLVAGAAAVGALALGLKSAVDQAREFDQAVKVLGVIAGATAPELAKLEESAKNIGATTQFSAPQVVELQTELARLGFTVPEILASTEAIGNLAIITQEDLGASAETVAQVINAYGLAASDATNVTNVLAEGFNRTSLDLSKFDFAFRQVGATSEAVGIDLAATTAAIGALTDIGLSGEQAGTGLRNTLLSLADANSKLGQRVGFSVKSSKDFTRALEVLQGQSIDAATAAELVGKDSATALLGLIQNTEKVNTLFKQFSNVEADAAAKAAKQVGDTLEGDLKRAQSAVSGLAIEVGQALTPAVRFFVQLFSDGLTEVIETIKDVRFVFGQINSAVDSIKTPIVSTFEAVKAAINAIGGPLKTVFDFFGFIIDRVSQLNQLAGNLLSPLKQLGAVTKSLGIRDARKSAERGGLPAGFDLPEASGDGAAFNSQGQNIQGGRAKTPAEIAKELEQAEKDREGAENKAAAAAQKRQQAEQEAARARQQAIREEIAALDLLLLTTEKNSLAGLEIQKQRIAAETRLKLESVTGANAQALVQAEADIETQKLAARQAVLALGIAPIQAQELNAAQQLADFTTLIQQDAANKAVEIAQQTTAKLNAEEDKRSQAAQQAAQFRQQLNQEVQNSALQLAQEGVQFAAQLLVKNKDDEKAVARAQLIASYINELGAIAFRAAQNPANAVTAGGAGLAQYAALAGIATARFGIGLAGIAKLNTGGVVPGVGSTDTVPAMLTPGEAVINKRATALFAPVLDYINRSTGGAPLVRGSRGPGFNAGGLVANMATAGIDAQNAASRVVSDTIKQLPAPVVSVREINEVEKRVRVKESIRRLG